MWSWSDRQGTDCCIRTQGTGDYGQNIASQGTTDDIDGKEIEYVTQAITDQWYKGEFKSFLPFFGLAEPPANIFHATGHLTQVIWKGTQQVGCATVKCPAGTIFGMHSQFSVCNYFPAGRSTFIPPIHDQPWQPTY